MQTKVLKITGGGQDKATIALAAEIIDKGGLVAIPTETVYGLAANALNPKAVLEIFAVKGRPADNPLIVHICEMSELGLLAREVPSAASKLAAAFWPGPLTMVLPKSSNVPDETTCGLDSVAVRMPSHPVARAIIREAGVPLAAPSANLSGSPSPTTAQHCFDDLDGKIELIVDAGSCEIGVESTVVAVSGTSVRLLRPGGVGAESIAAVLGGELEIDPAALSQIEKNAQVLSPGMKYKHYSPQAKVVIVDSDKADFIAHVNAQSAGGVFALVDFKDTEALEKPSFYLGEDTKEQASRLFGAFRELDAQGARLIFVRKPDTKDIGLAVYNRMLRAAGFEEIAL